MQSWMKRSAIAPWSSAWSILSLIRPRNFSRRINRPAHRARILPSRGKDCARRRRQCQQLDVLETFLDHGYTAPFVEERLCLGLDGFLGPVRSGRCGSKSAVREIEIE